MIYRMKKASNFCILFFAFFYSFSQSVTDPHLNIFFEVNKYELKKEDRGKIDSAINGRKITITYIKGFADSTGSDSYNMELSHKRALAVFSYLKDMLYVDSLKIEFFGEQQESGKDISFNRRVEVDYKETISQQENIPQKKDIADTLAVTEKYEISNIYFIPDKAIVDPTSFFAVDDAVKYLKHFPGCKFEIVGHVNYVIPPRVMNNPKALEPAQKLSEERAKTIYDLLAERGIPIESMTYKGVGNSQMVFKTPKNDEEKRKNMRVEILIACKK